MDGVGEEVAPIDAAEGAHLQSKEGEYTLKLESCNILHSREIVMPGEVSSPETSFHVFGEMLDGKNVNRDLGPVDLSKHPCTSPRTIDDAGGMVEELTVRNYGGSNIPIVGTSNNRETIQMRQSRWHHLYHLGGSGSGSSCGNRNNCQAMPLVLQDEGYTSFPEFLGQKVLSDEHNEAVEQVIGGSNAVSGSIPSQGGIKTKILSKSGFSEFFVKTTLKGKGIICRGPRQDSLRIESREQNNAKSTDRPVMAPNASLKAAGGPVVVSNASVNLASKTVLTCSYGFTGLRTGNSDLDGVSLREWLKVGSHKENKAKSMYIFRQIVDLVDCSHSQAVVMCDLRPSCFKLLQSNQVKYIGSSVQKEPLDSAMDKDFRFSDNLLLRRRPMEQGMLPTFGVHTKKQKFNESMNLTRWPMFHSRPGLKVETINNGDPNMAGTQFSHKEYNENQPNTEYNNSNSPHLSSTAHQQSTFANEQLEEKWYASPEELSEGIFTVSSNIYSLGILLFELLCHFDSERGHAVAMSDLRHRIFPPNFLSENLKEAGFCLRLLHPDPSLRPTTRDILQSEVISGFQEIFAEELSSSIDQEDAESELLLHFLTSLKEQKEKHASKLVEDIRCLETDIEEVERRHCSKKPLDYSSINAMEKGYPVTEPSMSKGHYLVTERSMSEGHSSINANETRLMRNISQLETAYFLMRSKIQLPESDLITRQDKELLKNSENHYLAQNDEETEPSDCIGAFFDGLCKYARYNKFEVRGLLRSGEFNNSANVICSLSFDRDEDYFAAAGVSKKIKIFEFNSLFNDTVDIHYPVIEMPNKSKLSCVCWNSYIKNYLASTDYDGMVKLWDASTGQPVSQYTEHEKRTWSVDFSQVHPTNLASGSDDCSVKLWSINERNCLGTIRNIANVCCVQFSAHSSHLLAFGSADYKTYCYDLRNARVPWCVLSGHDKAVSYVKFLDSETVVTASTDNTLKLWDLNKTNSSGLSTNACSLTFRGHTNEKNFVGLSVVDGYIACGSETNEVYAYYRSLPMPVTSHKFGSIDPISGKETDEDNGLFVSSVCWRGKSDMIVAANSSGCIKVLQMV